MDNKAETTVAYLSDVEIDIISPQDFEELAWATGKIRVRRDGAKTGIKVNFQDPSVAYGVINQPVVQSLSGEATIEEMTQMHYALLDQICSSHLFGAIQHYHEGTFRRVGHNSLRDPTTRKLISANLALDKYFENYLKVLQNMLPGIYNRRSSDRGDVLTFEINKKWDSDSSELYVREINLRGPAIMHFCQEDKIHGIGEHPQALEGLVIAICDKPSVRTTNYIQ
jgi:hypothetical protein